MGSGLPFIYLVEYVVYKSVAIQYNHHGVVSQLLRQYRACVVDSVLWYIHRQACLLRAYISCVSMLSSTGSQKRSMFRISYTILLFL